MKYIDVCGKNLSAMSLGTVQLGMNYGIANTNGQPKIEQSKAMLECALKSGITSLDTARAYGQAEDVLGEFFKDYGGEMPFLTTKVHDIQGDTYFEIEKFILNSVETSLEKMGVNKVNCIMLHTAANLFKNGDMVASAMESLVKRGYTDIIGASVYVGEEIDKLLTYDVYSAVQVPMSIFDQRLIAGGYIDRLADRGFTVFVRSVFLQGLFFLDPDKITDPILVKYAVPGIKLIREIAEREDMTVAELAISFMRDVPGVSSLVLGADTPDQVKSNIAYFDTRSISERSFNEIKEAFKDTNITEIMKVLSRPKN
jgi:aryl-alcohol dehydrogenase-like predicted oxidoreductase